MKSFILASLFIFVFSSSAFADFSGENTHSVNAQSSIDQQKMINSSMDQKAEALEKIRELACKSREQALSKHASRMP